MTDTETRTVATLDELETWAVDERKWKAAQPAFPTATVIGELADQIRRRFDVDQDAPIRVTEAYDLASMRQVLSIDVNYTPATLANVCDVSIASEDMGSNYDWNLMRAWLDGEHA